MMRQGCYSESPQGATNGVWIPAISISGNWHLLKWSKVDCAILWSLVCVVGKLKFGWNALEENARSAGPPRGRGLGGYNDSLPVLRKSTTTPPPLSHLRRDWVSQRNKVQLVHFPALAKCSSKSDSFRTLLFLQLFTYTSHFILHNYYYLGPSCSENK